MTAVVIRTKEGGSEKNGKNGKVWKKNTTCQKILTWKNPIYHIIRALSPVPSHLAEFYSHKEWCLALVICFVMERPALLPMDYTVDYVNDAQTRGHSN